MKRIFPKRIVKIYLTIFLFYIFYSTLLHSILTFYSILYGEKLLNWSNISISAGRVTGLLLQFDSPWALILRINERNFRGISKAARYPYADSFPATVWPRGVPWDRILSLLKHYRNGRACYRNVESIVVTVIDKRSCRFTPAAREQVYERNCGRINSNHRCHRRSREPLKIERRDRPANPPSFPRRSWPLIRASRYLFNRRPAERRELK